jgi:hypothetical protein
MYSIVRTAARRVRCVVAECNYAQRRLAALRANPERYLLTTDRAPDSYQVFLLLTSRKLAHEPSAAQRSAGAAVGLAACRTAHSRVTAVVKAWAGGVPYPMTREGGYAVSAAR